MLKFLLTVLLTWGCILPVVAEDIGIDAVPAELFEPKYADHILLVAFKDASINRIPNGSSEYRQRGAYQSTAWSERLGNDIAEQYHLRKLTEWPMSEVDEHCVVFLVPPQLSVSEVMSTLQQDQRIDIVQNLQSFSTRAMPKEDPYQKLQTNLQRMEIDQIHAKATGKDVNITMIDTGVDLQHPDLDGQIERNENFAESFSTSFTQDQHGTAIAGIIVAKKANGTGIVGIAPDAKLTALKACWPKHPGSMEAVCNSYTLALAVNNAIKNGAKILNMSLTGPYDPLLALLINKAISKGIIVVASQTGSGLANENFPAMLAKVIAVQSLRHSAEASNKAIQIIQAPGEHILTTLPYSTYDFISGSSMAAAEISGVIALLLEINPELSAEEIKAILLKSNLSSSEGVSAKNAVLAVCALSACAEHALSFVVH